jgi:hypothetical protein
LDIKRGERAITTPNVLLQVNLVVNSGKPERGIGVLNIERLKKQKA